MTENPPRDGECGFALVELIVVMILIGILAALALTTFIGESAKGADSSAKTDVRNVVSLVEACRADSDSYMSCDSPPELDGALGLSWGNSPGQVRVTAATESTFDVTAISHAKSDGSNHTYTWAKVGPSSVNRTCTAGAGNDGGGCSSGSW